MRKISALLIAVCALLVMLTGCAYHPRPNTQTQVTAHNNEILVTPDFTVCGGPWFDGQKFMAVMEERKNSVGAPTHVRELFDKMLPQTRPTEVKMVNESKEGRSAFLALGVYLNDPNVTINFQSGGLTLILKGPQETVEVTDRGCLFAYYEGMNGICYDSALGQVHFTRNFNNSPNYDEKPNIVYVRLDPKYNAWKLLGLRIDPKRVFVVPPTVASKSD